MKNIKLGKIKIENGAEFEIEDIEVSQADVEDIKNIVKPREVKGKIELNFIGKAIFINNTIQ